MTLAIIALIFGGMVTYNIVFEKEPITAAQQEASEDAAETIQLAEAAGEEAAAAASEKEEEAAKDVPRIDDVETADEWPEEAPDTFKLLFKCSNGDFLMEVDKSWAPLGAERFFELCKDDFYDGARFFRVVPDFVVQFGLAGDPAKTKKWDENLKDDPVLQSNTTGMVTFATAGPNTRTTQLFINLGNNERLDGMGFAPFGKVLRGMDVVQDITSEYGQRPDQGMIKAKGNEYLSLQFPNMDYIDDVLLVK
jgi:peptidyl-prolyl cis-trans isomerase A (cyclophilin A)